VNAPLAIVLVLPLLVIGLWFLLMRGRAGGNPSVTPRIVQICVGLLITWGVIVVMTALLTN
jgi:hypothetical protein